MPCLLPKQVSQKRTPEDRFNRRHWRTSPIGGTMRWGSPSAWGSTLRRQCFHDELSLDLLLLFIYPGRFKKPKPWESLPVLTSYPGISEELSIQNPHTFLSLQPSPGHQGLQQPSEPGSSSGEGQATLWQVYPNLCSLTLRELTSHSKSNAS